MPGCVMGTFRSAGEMSTPIESHAGFELTLEGVDEGNTVRLERTLSGGQHWEPVQVFAESVARFKVAESEAIAQHRLTCAKLSRPLHEITFKLSKESEQ